MASVDKASASKIRESAVRERLICLLLGSVLLLFAGNELATAHFGPGIVSHLARFGEVYADSWDDWGFGKTLGVPLSLNTGSTVVDRVPYAYISRML